MWINNKRSFYYFITAGPSTKLFRGTKLFAWGAVKPVCFPCKGDGSGWVGRANTRAKRSAREGPARRFSAYRWHMIAHASSMRRGSGRSVAGNKV